MGRVDKFIAKRKAASGYVKKGKEKKETDTNPKTLKEMLEVKKKAEAVGVDHDQPKTPSL